MCRNTRLILPGPYTQTSTGQGFINPKHNNEISVSFSEEISSAVSLQDRQLRTILPAIKLPANSEAVKVSTEARQDHSRHDIQTKELAKLLPREQVRLLDPQTKK